jgi:hypothetical protein
MSFWDDVILRVFVTFVDGNPPGRIAAHEALEALLARPALATASLNLTSLQICLLPGDAGSPVDRFATARFRPMLWDTAPAVLAEAMLRACPSSMCALDARAGELCPLPGGVGSPAWKLLFGAILRQQFPALVQFLGRTLLLADGKVVNRAARSFTSAYLTYNLSALIESQGDFVRWVYLGMLKSMSRSEWPSWPVSLPWGPEVTPDEIGFLAAVHGLPERQYRLLVLLAIYARLNIDQIAWCLQQANPGWTPQVAEATVKRAFLSMFSRL